MAKRSGLTRGDRRRNDRIDRLRAVVRPERAILAIDLGEDKQVAVVIDHEGRVLGRRSLKVKAYQLGGLLDWAGKQAADAGFAGVVVGCEPTGHRWKAVMALADAAGMPMVCVQPLRVHLAREEDDYTRDKTDHKDAVLIGKLIARLDGYLPERAEASWARLRHLGQRRARLIVEQVACAQQILDLLGCCWPAVLACAVKPLECTTWLGALTVTVDRCNGDPARLRRMGLERFLAAVRRELPRVGGKLAHRRIVTKVFAALTDRSGAIAQRRGGLERVGLLMADWRSLHARLAEVEQRMVQVLDELGIAELAGSIPGVSPVGAAAILAETGDLSRFASARSVVKHAGLNPTEHTSATIRGKTTVSRRGRPGLRVAAWRAVWGALRHNQVLAHKHAHLTGRDTDRLTPGQARIACAAALLRWLYAIITSSRPWDAKIAAGRAHPTPEATSD